jgi:type II secretory pathway pseudopilin PulG
MKLQGNGTVTVATVVVVILALLGAGVFQVTTNASHSERLRNLEIQNASRNEQLERIEAKVDRVLELVYARTGDVKK